MTSKANLLLTPLPNASFEHFSFDKSTENVSSSQLLSVLNDTQLPNNDHSAKEKDTELDFIHLCELSMVPGSDFCGIFANSILPEVLPSYISSDDISFAFDIENISIKNENSMNFFV